MNPTDFEILKYIKNGDCPTWRITAIFRIDKKESNKILRNMENTGLIERSVWSKSNEILWTITKEGVSALEAAKVRKGSE